MELILTCQTKTIINISSKAKGQIQSKHYLYISIFQGILTAKDFYSSVSILRPQQNYKHQWYSKAKTGNFATGPLFRLSAALREMNTLQEGQLSNIFCCTCQVVCNKWKSLRLCQEIDFLLVQSFFILTFSVNPFSKGHMVYCKAHSCRSYLPIKIPLFPQE